MIRPIEGEIDFPVLMEEVGPDLREFYQEGTEEPRRRELIRKVHRNFLEKLQDSLTFYHQQMRLSPTDGKRADFLFSGTKKMRGSEERFFREAGLIGIEVQPRLAEIRHRMHVVVDSLVDPTITPSERASLKDKLDGIRAEVPSEQLRLDLLRWQLGWQYKLFQIKQHQPWLGLESEIVHRCFEVEGTDESYMMRMGKGLYNLRRRLNEGDLLPVIEQGLGDIRVFAFLVATEEEKRYFAQRIEFADRDHRSNLIKRLEKEREGLTEETLASIGEARKSEVIDRQIAVSRRLEGLYR